MSTRTPMHLAAPQDFKALLALENHIGTTNLNPTHKELIKIRASQINGCAYCINMHTTDARKNGESEKRIYLLNAWRESDLYTEEEKAILALTEEVTLITGHVSDAVYNRAAELFDKEYLAHILLMIVAINAWNRIGIATGLRA